MFNNIPNTSCNSVSLRIQVPILYGGDIYPKNITTYDTFGYLYIATLTEMGWVVTQAFTFSSKQMKNLLDIRHYALVLTATHL